MRIEILRIDGSREEREIPKQNSFARIYAAINCHCCDTVNLRDGRVMIVDDNGRVDERPRNPQATALYHSIYPLAKKADTPICGDVVIADDEDFA